MTACEVDTQRRPPDIVFGKVDAEAEQSLAGWAAITSIPTLMVFRAVFRQPGALAASALDKIVARVRALDIDEIRAQAARSQADAESTAAAAAS